jgi:ATP-binding cassette, subfamily F, member 3
MIRVENLKKSYGPKVILKEASFYFPQRERIALVGPNGAGKTTLLNILCGTEESDGGEIIKPGGLSIGYLPQEPNANPCETVLKECLAGGGDLQRLKAELEEAMLRMSNEYTDENHARFERLETQFRNVGGYALEARAKGILAGLGFDAQKQESSPKSLSGGWRMRLELAKIFLNNPGFLILDEPTNHLDLPSLVWVEKYLMQFEGTLLFVSHDKDLLNRLSTVTLFLHGGKLESYRGNFDSFLEQREQRLELEASQAEQLRKRRQELERFVERFGAKATKAKQAQSRMKTIARIQEMEESLSPEETQDALAFRLPLREPSGKEVWRIEGGAIGYTADRPLSKGLNLRIFRGQKIAIIGANGIGKSTLLKTIASRIDSLGGKWEEGLKVKLAYFAQDQLDELQGHRTILENMLSSSLTLTERQARSLLGSFLFRGDDVYKPVQVLSGGEKSRVGLARVLVQEANFLLLDEPTNHLDMTSCEILAQAVCEYEGTVLFVSHDRSFINEVCTHVFAMLPDGRGALFEGNLQDYERLAFVGGFPNVLAGQVGLSGVEGTDNGTGNDGKSLAEAAVGDTKDNKELRRERQKKEKALARAEEEMENLQLQIAQVHKEMESVDPSDYKKLQSFAEKEKSLRFQLTTTEDVWLGLQEELS